jgi:N-acyl-D-amino-acid deacylase
MRPAWGLVLAILFGARAGAADDPKPTGHAAPGLRFLDATVMEVLEKYKIPGAAVAIAKDGKLVFARGYGWADLAARQPVLPTSLFNLASCTKPFTAAAILKLVDEEKLRLDDPVYKLIARDVKLPRDVEVDDRYYRITVRQMLHHAAGLPHDGKNRGGQVTLEEYVAENMREPLLYDPGTKTEYSNLGFLVLRLVVKHAAGETFETYSREHVLAPCGIKDMRLDSLRAGYFDGEAHRYFAGSDKPLRGGQSGRLSEDGGSWTASAVDVLRFMTALDGSRGRALLSKEAYAEMLSPLPSLRNRGRHNGLGWDRVERRDGKYFYEKNGGIAGISTWMEHQPDGVNFAILFNASPGEKKDPDNTAAVWRKSIIEAIRNIQDWPQSDFFEKFP